MRCDDVEVEAFQGLDGARRVRIGHRDVHAARIERSHRIGAAGQDRLDDRGVVAGHLVTERTGPERELRRADALRFDLGRKPEGRIEQDVEIGLEAGRPLRPPVAADAIDIAADRE